MDPLSATDAAQLSAIVESAPMAIVLVNGEGRIGLVNREAEALFGYQREELLGQPVEMLVPEEFRHHHAALRSGFFGAPLPRRMGAGRDLDGLRRDGTRFPVEIGLNPIETEEGTFVLAAIVDITERRRAEQRLRATVEAAPTAMVMIDASGAIVLVNAEAEKIFGYPRAELMGRQVEVLVPERFRSIHPQHRARFFKTPEARAMGAGRDLYALRKDGTEFPVEIGLNPIETDEGLFVVSAIVDITQRKRLEEALRQANERLEQRVQERTRELSRQAEALRRSNEALERSNLELQHFAYVASHDLQSPLRAISGFVQLLQAEYGGRLDAQADDWIGRTVRAIGQMQTMIHDILAYSRVDSRARPFQRVSMRAVVDEALSMLEISVRDSQALVRCGDLPEFIGDRSQLVQLMQNLLGNALTYHGDAPPRVDVSAEKKGHEWVFAVRDTGIGIDPKYHERIFEIFKRLHTQQEYPGSGIGLAVCRRVVHRHGGRIWVESERGKGSAFFFTLPESTSNE